MQGGKKGSAICEAKNRTDAREREGEKHPLLCCPPASDSLTQSLALLPEVLALVLPTRATMMIEWMRGRERERLRSDRQVSLSPSLSSSLTPFP